MDLRDQLEALPDDQLGRATAHSSWVRPRSNSYERLAFVGDTLLDLIVTQHLDGLFSPQEMTPGVLTRIRASVVSDDTLRTVAKRIGLDATAVRLAPEGHREQAEGLVAGGKPLASMLEAMIAVCWETVGPEKTAVAVIESFGPELERAAAHPIEAKSELQELLARTGSTVHYQSPEPSGPPHAPTFHADAIREPESTVIGQGEGSSKKIAETAAAVDALAALYGED
ncbi:MAG: putative dsRNA-binding protein [Solirubrobacterales bacterium]|nr:putative dsRNA-binding protein [Solirubrobacterales bacterium]